jgi:cell wall assembly regulator SMI1
MWVQRLLDFTDREPSRIPVDWNAIEENLGFSLPEDYKELYEAFGGGVFGGEVSFLACDEGQVFDLLTQWRAALAVDQNTELGDVSAVAPHKIYAPGSEGLVPWGSTEWGDEYFWSVDSSKPAACSIVARVGDSDRWHTFDISTSEFLYRVLTDAEFRPFGVAQHGLPPTFEPGSADE